MYDCNASLSMVRCLQSLFWRNALKKEESGETDMPFSDPNEQGGISLLSPYARPYAGRRRFGGCLLGVLLTLLVVGGGLGFWYWQTHRSVTLSVGPHPTIRTAIIGCLGTAIFQAGPANQVTFTGNIPSYTQNSSTNTIELGRATVRTSP